MQVMGTIVAMQMGGSWYGAGVMIGGSWYGAGVLYRVKILKYLKWFFEEEKN